MRQLGFVRRSWPACLTGAAELENLNEQSLLEELEVRYNRDIIYTYVGEILVAMNPYKSLRRAGVVDYFSRIASLEPSLISRIIT